MADDKWPDPDAPWIPLTGPLDGWESSGGLCLPSAPYYSFGLDAGPWTWPDNYWPRRFHPFPRIDRAARALREARWRARHAWLIVRYGADDY